MQPAIVRGPRGVQLEDVWTAADAVLAQGDRPTIERVRQQLGRGSPNTVGPMLDSWYAQLSRRLQPPSAEPADASSTEEGLPGPVARAARALWGRAVQQADEQATARLETAKAELALQADALRQAQEALADDAQRLADRSAAYALAMQAKDEQIAELGRLNEAQQQQLADLQQQLDGARADCAQLRQTVETDRRQHETRETEYRAERSRWEDRAQAQERRLNAEVDRARQESRRLSQQLEQDAKKASKATADALDRIKELEAQLARRDIDTASLLQELESARAEVAGLQARLDERDRQTFAVLQELRDRLPPTPTPETVAAARPRKVRVRR